MNTELDVYSSWERSGMRDWLEDPRFIAFAEKKGNGYLEQFKARCAIDEQRLNSPQFRKRVEERRRNMRQEEMQGSDYSLLGLTNHQGELCKKDVRNAYRRQARKLHPDKGGSNETFKQLYAAYRRVLAVAKI